jgi:hypothetical protein
VEQLPLQFAIAFFALQVVAWAGLCFYLRISHQRRAVSAPVAVEMSDEVSAVAQAA